jgi:hypothetical protein
MPEIGPPHLFGDEPKLMQRVLDQGVSHYMEFGLGGSTLAAVRAGAQSVIAVDSDANWVAAVSGHPEIAPLIDRGAAVILHADIGPIVEWGHPKDRSHLARWHAYIAAPWAACDRRGTIPDLIYVDGRFRVGCCFSIAVAFAGRSELQQPRVLLHDVDEGRPGYRDVFTYLDLIEQIGGLCLMQVRRDASPIAAMASLLQRQFDAL